MYVLCYQTGFWSGHRRTDLITFAGHSSPNHRKCTFSGGVNLQTQATKSLLNLMTNLGHSSFWLRICLNLNGIKKMLYTVAYWSRLTQPLTSNHLEIYPDGWFFIGARSWRKRESFDLIDPTEILNENITPNFPLL